MTFAKAVNAILASSACVIAFATPAAAQAQSFRIPAGDMKAAVDSFIRQSGAEVIYRVDQLGVARTKGVNGVMSPDAALRTLLSGSGLESKRDASGAFAIVPARAKVRPAAYREQAPVQRYAQEDATPSSPGVAARSDQLDEIIVTARRREESLMDVPVAVTAVSGAQLQKAGVSDLGRVAKLIPQVVMADAPAGTGASFSVRGIGTSSQDPGLEQSVLVMLDGTPITRGRIVLSGMFDLAQIEVLKGPQSLFFGKNSPAGVISITSAGPTDTLEGYIRAGYEFNAREKYVEAAISGPLGETLAGRLAFRGSDMKGWLRNRATPLASPGGPFFPMSAGPSHKRLPGTRELMGRATLQWEPSSDFDATLRVTLADRKDGGVTTQQYCDPAVSAGPVTVGGVVDPNGDCKFDKNMVLAGTPSQYITPEWRKMRSDGKTFQRMKTVFSNFTMNYNMDDVTLTSVSSYWKINFSSLLGYDYTSYGLANSVNIEESDGFTQEFRVVTDFDGPVNLSLGGFYEKVNRMNSSDSLLLFVGAVPPGQPGEGRYDSFYSVNNAKSETISGFGQVRWEIVDGLELSGGVRYTKETRKQRVSNRFFNAAIDPLLGPFVPVGMELRGKFKDSNWSPEVSLSYKPIPELMLYGAYKTGYKSGGFPSVSLFKLKPDLSMPTAADFAFGPEKAKGGELGIKAQLFDRALRVELTAYRYKFDDLQQSIFNPSTYSFSILNAADARIRGIELQTDWRATHELRLNASIAYNDAKFLRYPNSPCYTTQTAAQGCVGGSQDLAGRRLPRAPEWNVIGGFSYDTDLATDWRIGLNGDISYRSGYATQETQPPRAWQKGFALVNAGARFYTADDQWELAFIGRNLTNRYYVELGTQATFAVSADQLHAATPRSRELRVQGTYRF